MRFSFFTYSFSKKNGFTTEKNYIFLFIYNFDEAKMADDEYWDLKSAMKRADLIQCKNSQVAAVWPKTGVMY